MTTNEFIQDENAIARSGATSPWARKALWPLAIVGLLAAVYLVINLVLPGSLSAFTSSYVIQPILWCSLALGVLAISHFGRAKPIFTTSALWIGLLLGAFQVAALLIAALFPGSGFGHSPYAHNLRYLLLNTVFFLSAVVGLEFSRACLLSAFSKGHTTTVLILTALLYTFLMIPLTRLTHPGSTFVLLGGVFLPLLAQNMLASGLALVGGPVASIAYVGTLKAFEWYSPILPDSPWIINTFAVALSAVIGLLVIQSFYEKKIEPPVNVTAKTVQKSRSLVGWVMAGIICVVIIFATSGALGFRPTLVGSGSMGPALDVGDIAVITEVSADAIGEGDIIQFVDGRKSVIHRVVGVQDNDSLVFITKGDGNDSPDLNPVYPNQIQGIVKFRIPKVGWIAVGIKNLLS